jgi:hypothetical protein
MLAPASYAFVAPAIPTALPPAAALLAPPWPLVAGEPIMGSPQAKNTSASKLGMLPAIGWIIRRLITETKVSRFVLIKALRATPGNGGPIGQQLWNFRTKRVTGA